MESKQERSKSQKQHKTMHTVLNTDLKTANIPKRFWACSAQDVTLPKHTLISLRRYMPNLKTTGTGLHITGPSQTGKTTLLCLLLKHAMSSGVKVKFARLETLIELFYDSRNQKGEEREFEYKDFRDVELLGLDDIAGLSNLGHATVLNSILRERYNHDRPTFICTTKNEHDVSELVSDYGQDLAHRVQNDSLEINMEYDEKRARSPKAI